MTTQKRIAILISGRGSNMAALIENAKNEAYPAEIALVVSSRPEAAGLARASRAGIKTEIIDHTRFGKDREGFERALDEILRANDIEIVCLAGFMRLLTPWFVSAWEGRMINIHPSLLPAFKGLNTHTHALETGVKLHGATVHFVTNDMDSGPIIAQGAVPVLHDDDAETLGDRVLAVEHALYPHALSLIASGRARLENGRVVMDSGTDAPAPLIWPV